MARKTKAEVQEELNQQHDIKFKEFLKNYTVRLFELMNSFHTLNGFDARKHAQELDIDTLLYKFTAPDRTYTLPVTYSDDLLPVLAVEYGYTGAFDARRVQYHLMSVIESAEYDVKFAIAEEKESQRRGKVLTDTLASLNQEQKELLKEYFGKMIDSRGR